MSQKLITNFFEKAVPVRQEQVPEMSKATLDGANEAVKAAESGNCAADMRNRKRGSYNHVDSDTKYKIAKYTLAAVWTIGWRYRSFRRRGGRYQLQFHRLKRSHQR